MIRIYADELEATMGEKLLKWGVPEDIARRSAENLAQNSLDGIVSHGANRFAVIMDFLQKGYILPDKRPVKRLGLGAMEQWDGQLGMGNTNAANCMDRAMALAGAYGVGCVALSNTNHWMRGGAYGIQAARAGFAGICWTNTAPNMPAWGAKDHRIGNNPLILCVPHGQGYVLVDAAMAQYSYGAMQKAEMQKAQLPLPGGYNIQGDMTCDPGEIIETGRVLPIGYWKGSGFSILMDMMLASLSGGNSVCDIGKNNREEYGVSQLFIAMKVPDGTMADNAVERIIEDVKKSIPVQDGARILYPSEKEQQIRQENMLKGIALEETIWERILAY